MKAFSELLYFIFHPIKSIDNWLLPAMTNVTDISLKRARYEHEMHIQTCEYAEAMTGMYQKRIERLQAVQVVAA